MMEVGVLIPTTCSNRKGMVSSKKTKLDKMLRDFNQKRFSEPSREEAKNMMRDELVNMNRVIMKDATDKTMFKYFRENKKK